ncbi:peroxisome assembly protein (Peroxin-2) [Blyttiomyces sp. JEL0837]|nr:peroxisome assembly protein (Peroxin-2) [Blyttiomyces sp. JEL0837]
MVKGQFYDTVAVFAPSLKQKYDPEVSAVVQFMLNTFSIYASGASYGLQLQNLKYRNESKHSGMLEVLSNDAPLSLRQKIMHAVLTIGGRLSWLRLNRYMAQREWSERRTNDWRYRIWTFMQKAEQVYNGLSLLNFLVFLYDGRYRSLLDRMLRMRIVYRKREVARQVSYEFMNRQLVWHSFTEFLMFLIPVLNLPKLRVTLSKMFSTGGYRSGASDLPEHICAICVADNRTPSNVQVPYTTNCGHIYCYYCIR